MVLTPSHRLSGTWRHYRSQHGASGLDENRAEALRRLREIVAEQFPGEGFALVVWPQGPNGPIDYVSNAPQEDADAVLRSLVRRRSGKLR